MGFDQWVKQNFLTTEKFAKPPKKQREKFPDFAEFVASKNDSKSSQLFDRKKYDKNVAQWVFEDKEND